MFDDAVKDHETEHADTLKQVLGKLGFERCEQCLRRLE